HLCAYQGTEISELRSAPRQSQSSLYGVGLGTIANSTLAAQQPSCPAAAECTLLRCSSYSSAASQAASVSPRGQGFRGSDPDAVAARSTWSGRSAERLPRCPAADQTSAGSKRE